MMKQWTWIVLLVIYATAIGYMSHQSFSQGEARFFQFDKLLHLAEFGLFMLLAWHATGRRLALAWFLTLAFAGFDEFHQRLIPARDASVLDFIADLVGASLALGLIHLRGLLWRFFSTRILDR